MAEQEIPRWRIEIEAILREHYQGDELLERLKVATELVELIQTVEKPSGVTGQVIANILEAATEDLYPLASVYAAFQLGVAWERYQNANSSRKP